jgi:hypothetical protein
MHRQSLVVIIDLEKDPMTVCLERAEVMLLMRVVGVTEIVVDFDGLDDPRHGFLTKGGDARRHHGNTLGQILAQVVIQVANAVGIGRSHGGLLWCEGNRKLGPRITARAMLEPVRRRLRSVSAGRLRPGGGPAAGISGSRAI